MSAGSEPSVPSGDAASQAVARPLEANGIVAKAFPSPSTEPCAHGSVTARPKPHYGTSPGCAENDKPTHEPSALWRILSQCEIVNFATLRRHLGRPRADALVLDVAARITELLPDVRILTAGRALIEIGFERESPEAGAADIDRLR